MRKRDGIVSVPHTSQSIGESAFLAFGALNGVKHMKTVNGHHLHTDYWAGAKAWPGETTTREQCQTKAYVFERGRTPSVRQRGLPSHICRGVVRGRQDEGGVGGGHVSTELLLCVLADSLRANTRAREENTRDPFRNLHRIHTTRVYVHIPSSWVVLPTARSDPSAPL